MTTLRTLPFVLACAAFCGWVGLLLAQSTPVPQPPEPALQVAMAARDKAHQIFTRVWIKRDGRWLLAAVHNAVPPKS